MRVLLIIPAYNEEENIQQTVGQILRFRPEGYRLDYLIVNDGSTDRTEQICRENGYPCLTLSCNLGIGGGGVLHAADGAQL